MRHQSPATTSENTTDPVPLPALPLARPAGRPFDPPEELARLREQRPLARMVYPDGHVGWLATSHRAVRAVLADSRFSARYELLHYPFPGAPVTELPPAPPGDMGGIDAPEHTRYRRLLTGKFTVRRMRQLTERVEQITSEHLDAMRRQSPGRPGAGLRVAHPRADDLRAARVPYADRESFQHHAMVVAGEAASEEMATAYTALQEYMRELVLAKRANPTDDLLSDLTTSDLTEEELVGVGAFLLGAGLDTTANMLALGTFALLRNPGQFTVLRTDPDIVDRAVEELMRYLSITHTGGRVALEDVELDGQLIKANETVTISVQAANRDPEKYTDPDTLNLQRQATGQLGFGHGIHQCLGQQLARVEMRVAFPALVTRFPTLRLAVPAEEVPLRIDALIYGVRSLPVTGEEG